MRTGDAHGEAQMINHKMMQLERQLCQDHDTCERAKRRLLNQLKLE